MGSFDGAEVCELVGLFILDNVRNKYGLDASGLYQDDGLCCFHKISGPQSERLKKNISKLFKDEFDLKITIDTNLKVVNFLDVTFDLQKETYQSYSKPNSLPTYININSNHPPNIIKCIPNMISDRISKISSNKEVFDRAAPYYNEALKSSGYKNEIKYEKRPTKSKQTRKRQIIWFNPHTAGVSKANVAKRFLNIIDKNFLKNHKFRKILNRNTLKVSYSCLPNMSSIISSHNKKILGNQPNSQNNQNCNCRDKGNCPLNGYCLESSVIYKCHVQSSDVDKGKHYIGLTGETFKERWNGHKSSFRHEKVSKATEFSKYVWSFPEISESSQISRGNLSIVLLPTKMAFRFLTFV